MKQLIVYNTFSPNILSRRREGAKFLFEGLSLSYQVQRENEDMSNRSLAPLRLGESFFFEVFLLTLAPWRGKISEYCLVKFLMLGPAK